MDNNYMKTILSGIKEWTRSLIQKTADNAQVTADNAQVTADNAQRTADNAQVTADNAQRTADNAQAAADNAQATADNAQATADNALHPQILYDDQILIWDGTTTATESTVQVEYFTQVAKSGSTKKTRYYRISNIPDNIVKYAFAHYKDIKCAIKVQNGTENELELTNDWYVDYSGLCVSSSNYYILIARESGSHAVRIPGALQPTWLDFPQAGIYIGYCTDSSVEGDAGKSFTHKIALPTYGLPLNSVILTTDSDKNIQIVDTETGTKKTLKSAYAYAQDGGYTGTEEEFAAKLAAEKLPNPYPLTFTGAVSETYDGSSAKTIEIPSGGSGAHSDWNQNDSTAADYIKNRPFYTGDPVETVLVEESTVSFTEQGGLYIAPFQSTFEATAGEVYKVSWDGTVYECTCVDLGNPLVIGNLSIAGEGSDTGEPFLMIIMNGAGIEIWTADTSASHTFSISGIVAEVVKIDTKYLPVSTDDSYGVIKKSDIVSTYDFPVKAPHDQMVDAIIAFDTGNASIVWNRRKVIDASYDSSADTISVTFAHEPLRIHTYENSHGFYNLTLGSITYAELQGSLMRIGNNDSVYTTLTTEGTSDNRTLRVGAGKIFILGEFIGEALVLYSSTDKSTKKFKITVDDSGTISATEIVAES